MIQLLLKNGDVDSGERVLLGSLNPAKNQELFRLATEALERARTAVAAGRR